MTSNKLDIEQFIVDCIETYCKNRNIDRTICTTIFDDCLNKQGFKIKDHKLVKIENTEMIGQEQLVILDYSDQSIHIYNIDCEADINEDYIKNLGYNTDECNWMFGENIDVQYHKELLK